MSVITYGQYAKTRTDEELKTEARAIYDAIFKMDCLGAKSYMLLTALQNELHSRGYEIEETSELVITK